jgi:MFS transporter, DHA1 family, inner membrane transport protein
MTAAPDIALPQAGIRRDAVTWYCYLLLSFFTYLISAQGNIVPFLKLELDLNYREVSLHTSAIALGTILDGFIADRIVARFGRRMTLAVGALGAALGAILLTLATAAWASLASCLMIGVFGALIPAIQPAILSDIHGPRRDIAFTEGNALCYAFAIMGPLIAGFAAWQGISWRLVPLTGAAVGIAIVLGYVRYPIAGGIASAKAKATTLPPAFWAYWAMLGFAVALEFSVLLWAPAYLQQVIGLSASAAAVGATAFFAGMLIGRTIGVGLVRYYPARNLFFGAAATTLVGFAAWWGSGVALVAIAGLFGIGLGISLLFPLTLTFAMGAAGAAADRASARIMLAPGLAVLVTPPFLGAIADGAGLWPAQVMVAVFLLLALAAFLTAEFAERRAA